MADPPDDELSDLVPQWSRSLSEREDEDLAFGVSVREASGPRPNRRGVSKVFAFTLDASKRTGMCLLRFAYGTLEWPIAKVHELQSRIAERNADMQRRTERDAIELSILRTKAESDRFDLDQKKALAERETAMRVQAESDILHHLAQLNMLGVTVNIVQGESNTLPPATAEVLEKSIEQMDFSVRLTDTLSRVGARTMGDVIQLTEDDLNKAGVGTTGMSELQQRLAQLGLTLSD